MTTVQTLVLRSSGMTASVHMSTVTDETSKGATVLGTSGATKPTINSPASAFVVPSVPVHVQPDGGSTMRGTMPAGRLFRELKGELILLLLLLSTISACRA
jgi:hypothetical protein